MSVTKSLESATKLFVSNCKVSCELYRMSIITLAILRMFNCLTLNLHLYCTLYEQAKAISDIGQASNSTDADGMPTNKECKVISYPPFFSMKL